MKAVFCEDLGTPQQLVVRDIDPPPPPQAGEIRVALKARGVSFTDILMIKGEYQAKPELPFIVGGEASGVITEVGPEVQDLSVGDSVLVSGGCVEEVVVKATRATLLPEGVNLDAAAAFRGNYATALYGMQRANLRAGETLLVHGAAGGVGLAAVDIGKLMGARVIGTASSEAKLAAIKEMGGDYGIDYRDGFREQVKALTNGKGADVIYDPVGGDVFDESMRCIAPFGRILIVGFTSGRAALAKTNHLLIKDASVIGYTMGGLQRHDPEWAARNGAILVDWLASGRIHPYISHRMPLDKTADALQLIIDREVIGKAIVLS
ncbi:MAG: NADPH:quinone oxidoreductase family protein [Gammaproteobacteria bacterium]|nr:NADPH:quinone oxidoreductase family protein [Gammaproteobacteria bacterium]